VTGHSMGAAMASLASIDIVREVGRVNILYSLANPRVGNKAFAKFVEE